MGEGCCDNACCNCLWKYYSPFVRTCGVLVAGALWAIGVTQLPKDNFYIYIIVVAFLVSFLELLIFIAPCCDRCCSREGSCYVFWEYVQWLDNWKRAIVYLLLSVFCYIRHQDVMAIVAGAILDVLALVYIIRTYRIRSDDDLDAEDPVRGGGGRSYGRFHNEDAKREMAAPTSSTKGSEASSTTDKKASERAAQLEALEQRYSQYEPVNPFGNSEEKEKDDDIAPEGDAGLTRYPP